MGPGCANIAKANNVYPVKLNVIPQRAVFAAWTTEGEDPTQEESMERLGKVAMLATAKGADQHKGDAGDLAPTVGSFRAVVVLAEIGADGMVITDLPKKIPGRDACAACVGAKSVHFPHKEGRNCAGVHLDRVHIDVAGPMPTKSAGGMEYEYIVVYDYSRGGIHAPIATQVGRTRSLQDIQSRRREWILEKDARSHNGQCARVEYGRAEADL